MIISMWPRFQKLAIALFVIWHAFAVAVYPIPRDARDPIAMWVKLDLLPIVTPYMLITSQWQLWNLFSPDPLRRVTFYKIEAQSGDTWHEIETIQPGSFSTWRHAVQFKLMSNMLDEFSQNRAPLAGRYLHLKCEEYGLAEGTSVRLTYMYYVIPYHERRESRAWWDAWKPEMNEHIGFTTECPTSV